MTFFFNPLLVTDYTCSVSHCWHPAYQQQHPLSLCAGFSRSPRLLSSRPIFHFLCLSEYHHKPPSVGQSCPSISNSGGCCCWNSTDTSRFVGRAFADGGASWRRSQTTSRLKKNRSIATS